MTDTLGIWVKTVTGTSLLCAAALVLLPEGKVKKTARIIFGFVMLFALMSLFRGGELPDYSETLNMMKFEAQEISGSIEEKNDALIRTIIEERSEAYILDKGASLGLDIKNVKVTAKWSNEGFWYPFFAEICATEQSGKLQYCLTSELGIVPENIIWTTGAITNENAD